jgi:hypothetical protein
MQKPATFQQERLLFLFNFSKISCSKHKGISLNLRATYALNALQKLMKKDFFLATDVATQSSNKKANEKREKKNYFSAKWSNKGKMPTSTKPRKQNKILA